VKRALLWVADHPVAVITLVLAITIVLGAQLPRLRIDESSEGLMVQRDPARQFYEKTKQRFGSDNLTIVLVKADDVFNPAVLQTVKRLSDAFARLANVSRVESLSTVKNLKGEGDMLTTDPLIGDAVPESREALARLRTDALGSRLLVGNLVAANARATAIAVYVEPAPGDTTFNQRFAAAVDSLIARESRPGIAVAQTGVPFTKATYARYLEDDQKTVIPIGMAVLLATLFLAFRMLQGVLVPVVTAVVSIVWALGLMAVTGIPITILTAIIPSLLLGIGFTEDVHMISEYHRLLEAGVDKLTAIHRMLEESATPIVVTTATTVLGFGSLIFTDIPLLIEFGWASSMALTANCVATLLILPVMLRAWKIPRALRRSALADSAASSSIPRLMERLAEGILRWRVAIFAISAALVVLSLVGWYTVRVNTDLISFFPEKSEIRARIQDLHASLAGGLAFYVVVDSGREDGVKDPAVLKTIARLQDFLAGTGQIDKSVSLADYIRRMHREMHRGDPAYEVVPDDAGLIAQYLLMLEGPELAKFVDFDASAANVVVRHNLSGSGDLTALLRKLDVWVAANVPVNLTVRATGEAILFNNASDFMAINEITSFSSTLLVIGLVHAGLFMSIKAGVLSLVPNVVPILCLFGVMGALGIPLNTSTALIATIAIGIAVDDTVHHMVTYSRQLKAHHDQKLAMIATLRSQGRPIIYVSLALAAGFLTLVASKFTPTAQFGLLAAFVMLLAMVAELVLAPLLMYSTQLVTLWDLVLLRMKPETLRASPLLNGLSRWQARKVVLLGEMQRVPAGAFVIRKGDRGRDLYMLLTGTVRVFDRGPSGRDETLTVLGPGAVFGEIALVTDDPRSAWVIADSDADLLRLDFEAFERIRQRFPYTGAKLFRNLARVLGERLRETSTALVTARGAAVDEMVLAEWRAISRP
jgi:predicted RND superfamily exporter protein